MLGLGFPRSYEWKLFILGLKAKASVSCQLGRWRNPCRGPWVKEGFLKEDVGGLSGDLSGICLFSYCLGLWECCSWAFDCGQQTFLSP